MKLPGPLGNLFAKKSPEKELFLSLLLDPEYVSAALWEMGEKGLPSILASCSVACEQDSWDARIDATDEALAALEDKSGTTDYTKTVLGLPMAYLTQTGEI